MLPLWRDRLYIAVQPDRVILTRHSPFRQKSGDTETLTCPVGEPLLPWAIPVEMLRETLTEKRWHNTRATFVLSNHFVRYAVIPWEPALTNEAEIQLYARHHVTTIYGEQAQNWDIRVSPAPQGHARLASAIDETLMASLYDLPSIRLHSVQPYFMSAFNQWANKLNRLDFWFATVEHDRLTLALIRDGQWFSLRNRTLNLPLENELPQLLDQEAMLTGQTAGKSPVFVYAPEHGRLSLPPGSCWDTISVSDVFPQIDSDLAMALSGGY